MRLLIIEDDTDTAAYLSKGLREVGHTVDHAASGKDGLFMAASERYDGMIVDRLLPQVDGLTIISTLRAAGNTTPTIILSALGEVDDRVRGLRAGGDDYLVKPYSFAELLARLEAVLRRGRGSNSAETVLRVANLEMDLLARSVRRGSRSVDLKPQEFRLLEYLMRNAGQVVTRTMLFENVWDYHFDPQTNVIDVHISRLRGKIDEDGDAPLIQTVRGAGYCLRLPPASPRA
ncbi:MAG: Two-component system, OmpR family, response regulator [Hydrocarboniphaga sp.]|uniref:response regulator transcription factor n=1 Tax=Hydrocarboniphaga sp. TaxID=2033016 RepID=UPI00262E58CD|nr:response regulator transcription factor [Hydrocarboniphaga sp.]MDB5969040.1 Two-component system, OmpR family, response regulator [Hydrocarboniphaga sp.]